MSNSKIFGIFDEVWFRPTACGCTTDAAWSTTPAAYSAATVNTTAMTNRAKTAETSHTSDWNYASDIVSRSANCDG